MSYLERLQHACANVPNEVVDFSLARKRGRAPTQAFSEFLINREQGDWAERLVMLSINEAGLPVVAVKYGKSEDRVAGEEGFTGFYDAYQDELDAIGKRPDLLLFRRGTLGLTPGLDISGWASERLEPVVRTALAGLDIRSSAFLETEFRAFRAVRSNKLAAEFAEAIGRLRALPDVPREWRDWASAKEPRRSPPRASGTTARADMAAIRSILADRGERDFLSFTLKVEDCLVVRKWIETFGVPHFYVQVFFDKAYVIGFCDVLELLGKEPPGKLWQSEENPKNQFKGTVHVNTAAGSILIPEIPIPNHRSDMKRLDRGRMLAYIRFESVPCSIDPAPLASLWDSSDASEGP